MKEGEEKGEDLVLERYGIVVAINPLGQMIFSPVFGWLANKMDGKIR